MAAACSGGAVDTTTTTTDSNGGAPATAPAAITIEDQTSDGFPGPVIGHSELLQAGVERSVAVGDGVWQCADIGPAHGGTEFHGQVTLLIVRIDGVYIDNNARLV